MNFSRVSGRFLSTTTVGSPNITSLTQLEARWSKIPQAEQGAISDVVTELQKGDWKKMSLEQKRAGKINCLNLAYYIAYGAYGPRGPRDPTLQYRVFGWVAGLFGLSYVLWIKSDDCKFRSKLIIVRPKLVTHTAEWKAAEAQMMIEQKQNPHSGPYSVYLKNLEANEKK